MRTGKVEWWKSKADGQWYFRVKAENGKVLCASEGYRSKVACQNGITALIRVLCTEDAPIIQIDNG